MGGRLVEGVQVRDYQNHQQKKKESSQLLLDPWESSEGGYCMAPTTIDRKLTWDDHISNITKKANNTRAFFTV